MTVRLYGRTRGESSHARVTAGFKAALTAANKLAGLVGLDEDQLDDEAPLPGAQAPHGVLTGDLRFTDRMQQNAQHGRRWAMVAPNSTRLPDALLGTLMTTCTDLMAPSEWAWDVVQEEQRRLCRRHANLTELPVEIVPHGISTDFKADSVARLANVRDFELGLWRVLHFSTSERQRKGTTELLVAWEQLVHAGKLSGGAQLYLVLDGPAYVRIVEWMADRGASVPQVSYIGRMNASPAALSCTFQQIHLVCQPSRAEAFGLTPLEALACGVPIVATRCTGHVEYLSFDTPGFVEVQTGPYADIDDVPGGRAPSLEPDAIEAALLNAYERWPELAANALDNAAGVRAQFGWGRQLDTWLQKVE